MESGPGSGPDAGGVRRLRLVERLRLVARRAAGPGSIEGVKRVEPALVALPADFTLSLAADVRRPVPEVLIGGSPLRVLKLTAAGASLVDRWTGDRPGGPSGAGTAPGQPVGPGRAAGTLAARLVEAGMATPAPPPRAPTPMTSVTVVVPVKDDREGLAATLDALVSTAPGVPVVVVDDGSEPPAIVRADAGGGEILLVRRPSPGGPAAARNIGSRHTGTGRAGPGRSGSQVDVLVFVDAGCVPDAGWLETLLGHFADPGLGAVAPRVRNRPSPSWPDAPTSLSRYEDAHSPLDLGPDPAPVRPGSKVPYVPTAVLAVRLSALLDAGRFDEGFRFGEDVDLVWRLHERGWRIRYEPAATASHPARPDVRRWLRQRCDYGRSATPLAKRHGRAVAPLTVSPWSLAAWSVLVLGRPLPAIGIVAVTAELLARRAGPQVPVAAELRHLAYLGHIRAAGPIASAIRRAWLPPALVLGAVAWRVGGRRARPGILASAVAVLAGPGLADWMRQRRGPGGSGGAGSSHGSAAADPDGGAGGPGVGPLAWVAWSLADDLAYQVGVWDGALRGRSIGALLPKW